MSIVLTYGGAGRIKKGCEQKCPKQLTAEKKSKHILTQMTYRLHR